MLCRRLVSPCGCLMVNVPSPSRRNLLLGLAALSAIRLSPVVAEERTLVAHPADSFVEFLGINTHFWNRSSVYSKQFDACRARLRDLGIRYLRDSASGNYTDYAARVRDLHRDGLRFNFIVDPRPPTDGVAKGIDFVRGVREAAVSIEGPNEYDASRDPDWRTTLPAFQRDLHSAAREQFGDALPVIAPSCINTDACVAALGDMSGSADRCNLHHYFSGRNPGTVGWGRRDALGRYGSLPWALGKVQRQVPGRPVVVTESGYTTAMENPGGHRPVTEAIAGRYLPRMCLEFFNAGVERLFIYELLNAAADSRRRNAPEFGLLRDDANASPTPAFQALRNVIKLLAEPNAARFEPRPLTVQIPGAGPDVRTVLFQKSHGAFYLALWLEVPGWEPNAQRLIPVSPREIRVVADAGTASGKSAASLLQHLSLHTLDEEGAVRTTRPRATASGVPLVVTDRVTILEMAA